jgi:hypothetical protein
VIPKWQLSALRQIKDRLNVLRHCFLHCVDGSILKVYPVVRLESI